MKIAIGSDHAGYEFKEKLVTFLTSKGFDIDDVGPFSTDSVDYPDFAHAVAKKVDNGSVNYGVLLCGSAQGVTITANKHQNVRAALCWMTDIAKLARLHNNANIVTLPARFIAYEYAEQIVETFLKTDFEGGRHENRVNKIACS